MLTGGVKPVRSISYSSSANLGAGFDVLAICTDAFHDTVEAEITGGGPKIKIVSEGSVPEDPASNSASIPVAQIMHDFEISDSVRLNIRKGVPISSGLGGSGACAAAAVKAFNHLYSLGLDHDRMIRYAALGEIASGAVHYDNVAASTMGELALVLNDGDIKTRKIAIPGTLYFMIISPLTRLKVNTAHMRDMLPSSVTMEDHVRNTRYVSSLIAGILTDDRELIMEGLNDGIVEPARSSVYNYFPRLKSEAVRNGALGTCISGSGPAVIVVCDEKTDRNEVRKMSENVMAAYGHKCTVRIAKAAGGAEIED